MKQLGSLFEKNQRTLKPPQASVEKQVVETVMAVTGVTITVEQVTYQPATRTVGLQAPSIVRSEVMRQKKEVLRALRAKLGQQHAPTELL